jgi:CheY-like chemotaxis protein
MKFQSQSITILIAEDDQDDCILIREAFAEDDQGFNLVFVQDGIELFQYLRQQDGYAESKSTPRPDLILLDLNMPRMDGLEALAELKADLDFRSIPVVVLTISSTEQQVLRTYDLGGAGFIIKPVNMDEMVGVVKVLKQYWFEVVELSGGEHVKIYKNTNADLGS